MNKKYKLSVLGLIVAIFFSIGISLNNISTATTTKSPVASTTASKPAAVTSYTNALDIVANPTKYLNKKVKIRAKFDKFSVLGLDYKPAFKSSEKYITFLIKREDIINNVVPLSEMKNFLPRKTAEKYIDLKPGDIIEYTGTVFSDALSDAWVDVDSFTVIKSSAKQEKKAN